MMFSPLFERNFRYIRFSIFFLPMKEPIRLSRYSPSRLPDVRWFIISYTYGTK